jgi:hypothetical protein
VIRVDEAAAPSRYSRRAFLKHARAGAGAVAFSGAVGAAMAPRAVAARSATVSTSPTTFGRMFPNLPPFAPATDAVRAALADLGKPGGLLDANDDLTKVPVLLITDLSLSANNPNNPTHPAGRRSLTGSSITASPSTRRPSWACRQILRRHRIRGRRRSISTRCTGRGRWGARSSTTRPTATSCGSDSAASSRTCRASTTGRTRRSSPTRATTRT